MTSHPDADAFMRAILRDPADVTTRLVFADWLEETGEAVECRMGTVHPGQGQCRRQVAGQRRANRVGDGGRAVRAVHPGQPDDPRSDVRRLFEVAPATAARPEHHGNT